jgi:acetyltransferase-like isoleucine patch superfamily enzyme
MKKLNKMQKNNIPFVFRFLNDSNNPVDNRNRAIILGFPQEGVRVAPGTNIRLGEKGRIGKNVFVGLFSYINGDVVVEDNVLIGPHVCLTSNTHLFNIENQSFQAHVFRCFSHSLIFNFLTNCAIFE